MVEGTPLLRAQTRKGLEGSNPFVSATHPYHTVTLCRTQWGIVPIFLSESALVDRVEVLSIALVSFY